MKTDKIQAQLLKELLKTPERVAYYHYTSDDLAAMVAVCLHNGTVIYHLREDDLSVNLRGAQLKMELETLVDKHAAVLPLVPTDNYRLEGTARMWLVDGKEDQPVYINQKLLANFDEPQLFQSKYSPYAPVVVAELQKNLRDMDTVGMVMPVKVED